MKEFVKKVIMGEDTAPSENCRNSFEHNFPDAVNSEWHERENYFEVLFYRNNLEHIGLIDFSGELLEYRANYAVEHLPELVREKAGELGEIVSSVLRNKGNMLEYEILIRDMGKERYQLILTDTGEIIRKRKL